MDLPGSSTFGLLADELDACHARAVAAGAAEAMAPHDAEGTPRSSAVRDPSATGSGSTRPDRFPHARPALVAVRVPPARVTGPVRSLKGHRVERRRKPKYVPLHQEMSVAADKFDSCPGTGWSQRQFRKQRYGSTAHMPGSYGTSPASNSRGGTGGAVAHPALLNSAANCLKRERHSAGCPPGVSSSSNRLCETSLTRRLASLAGPMGGRRGARPGSMMGSGSLQSSLSTSGSSAGRSA